MAKPSAEIREAKGLSAWGQFKKGKTYLEPMTWVASQFPLQMRVVTCSERQECHADAKVRMADLGLWPVDTMTSDEYLDEVSTQILVRARRDANNVDLPMCSSVDELRDTTTDSERYAMMLRYRDLARKIDPERRELDPVTRIGITEALKKKDENLLREFGSCALASFLLTSESPPLT